MIWGLSAPPASPGLQEHSNTEHTRKTAESTGSFGAMADDQEQKPKLEGDDKQINIKIKDQARCAREQAPCQLGACLLSSDARISVTVAQGCRTRRNKVHRLTTLALASALAFATRATGRRGGAFQGEENDQVLQGETRARRAWFSVPCLASSQRLLCGAAVRRLWARIARRRASPPIRSGSSSTGHA